MHARFRTLELDDVGQTRGRGLDEGRLPGRVLGPHPPDMAGVMTTVDELGEGDLMSRWALPVEQRTARAEDIDQ